ncbi:hypothetical protein JCM19238_2293 [Vibrio ponticus]|nr:hypothetical protein JCM19238_2293 [Vibrio ponticus]
MIALSLAQGAINKNQLLHQCSPYLIKLKLVEQIDGTI